VTKNLYRPDLLPLTLRPSPSPPSLPNQTFDLYSTLSLLSKDSATTTSSNLGMVDGKKDILTISLTINPPRQLPTSSSNCSSKSTGRSSKATKKGKAGAQPVEIDILIAQDMQRLRGSGGDTGSVVWRSRWAYSLSFARRVSTLLPFPFSAFLQLN